MEEFSAKIERISNCEAVLEYVYAAAREKGATWISYHFTPVFESQTSRETIIWARDYPIEYQKLYIGAYRNFDPVPKLTFEYGPILTWRAAEECARELPDALEYLADLRTNGVDNWAGFALYGPRNRESFASLRFSVDPDELGEGTLTFIHSLLQASHLRICKIIDEREPVVTLSEREREVLEWVGRGKSAADIATILRLSPETVRTYTKRIYEKLESRDRVTATIRALKLGLVEL